jgi:hypothetical protein
MAAKTKGSGGIASRELAADDPWAGGSRRVVPLRWTDATVRSDD